jgi:hypothetical protein
MWQVNDLRISYIKSELKTAIIGNFSGIFGIEAKLTVHRGKVHVYLGVTTDFENKGKVITKMDQYINSILAKVPDDMHGIATTMTASHLFQVNNKSLEYPTVEKANLLHTMVAKLLFLAKRA